MINANEEAPTKEIMANVTNVIILIIFSFLIILIVILLPPAVAVILTVFSFSLRQRKGNHIFCVRKQFWGLRSKNIALIDKSQAGWHGASGISHTARAAKLHKCK